MEMNAAYGHNTKLYLGAAIASAGVLGVIGWILEPAVALIGIAAGPGPWLSLIVLEPRHLSAPRLHPAVRAMALVMSVVGFAGIAWLVAASLSISSAWLLAALLAVAVAVASGALSTTRPWLPFAEAALLIAASLLAIVPLAMWVSACPDCGVQPYGDAFTRAPMLSVWAILGGSVLTALCASLVLSSYVARLATRHGAAGRPAGA